MLTIPQNLIPRLLGAAFVSLAVAAPSAHAATVAVDGSTLVYTAADGETNTPLFNENRTGSTDDFTIIDEAHLTSIPDGCEYVIEGEDDYIACHLPGITTARVTLGDMADKVGAFSEWGARRFEVDAGPGDDAVNGPDGMTSLTASMGDGDDYVQGSNGDDEIAGGAGKDDLDGHKGNDRVDGGDDNDKVNGYEGDDTVLGGAGDDLVWGDNFESAGHDVIDGGAGYDTLESDYVTRDPDERQPPVAITLGGGADDGRPGENDDVTGVEDLTTTIESALTGTDAAEHLVVFQNLKHSELRGLGGDDDLKTSGGNDLVEAGAGNDTVDAGYGDDTITGGPGKDAIFADLRGGDCSPLWCTMPYGNDTVDVRDGEADSVFCGAGEDKVAADTIDTVAPDCEVVERGGKPVGDLPGTPVTPGATCKVPKVKGKKVKAAKRRIAKAGCKVKVRGRGKRVKRQSVKAGSVVAAGTVVRLKAGR